MPQRKRATGKLLPLGTRHPRHDEIEQKIDAMLHALTGDGPGEAMGALADLAAGDDDSQDLALRMLEKRLLSSRSDLPVAALDILRAFQFADPYDAWDRIAGSRGASDVMRLGARLRTGWLDDSVARKRVSFLKSMRSADQALVDLIEQGCLAWPLQAELLDEVFNYLEVVPPARRQAIVTQAAATVGPTSVLLLHSLLHLDDPALQQVVLKEIEGFGQPVSIKPVERLARTAVDDHIREAASTVAASLRARPVHEPLPPRVLPSVSMATVTPLAANGSRAVALHRAWRPSIQIMGHFLVNGETGLMNAYGLSHLTEEAMQLSRDEFEIAGAGMIDLPIEALRGAVAIGVQTSIRHGYPIPPRFELWEPLIHETWPAADDEAIIYPILADDEFAGDRRLLRSSTSLLDAEMFRSWSFDNAATSLAMELVDPPRGKWTNRQYEPLISHVVTIPVRATLRQSLRMQAWMLDHLGEHQQRDIALAVSASLVSATTIELVENPFLRRMMEETVNTMTNPLALLGSLRIGDLDQFFDDDDLDDDFESGDLIDIDDHRR